MKYSVEVTIDKVTEQCTHSVIQYDEVLLSCYRGTGDTLIKQGEDEILLELEQGKQLYKHLKSVFGDLI